MALQVLKTQPQAVAEHFRVMQNVDDFARVTVVFQDDTVAEVLGYDLSISGIRNWLHVIADCAEYELRVNPNNENELFTPSASAAGVDRIFCTSSMPAFPLSQVIKRRVSSPFNSLIFPGQL